MRWGITAVETSVLRGDLPQGHLRYREMERQDHGQGVLLKVTPQ